MGQEIGVGNYVDGYLDPISKNWIFIELIAQGTLPISMTTIRANGEAVHSRHSFDLSGQLVVSQGRGQCSSRAIR